MSHLQFALTVGGATVMSFNQVPCLYGFFFIFSAFTDLIRTRHFSSFPNYRHNSVQKLYHIHLQPGFFLSAFNPWIPMNAQFRSFANITIPWLIQCSKCILFTVYSLPDLINQLHLSNYVQLWISFFSMRILSYSALPFHLFQPQCSVLIKTRIIRLSYSTLISEVL